VVKAIRDSVGEDVVLMSDYNQSLSVAEAGRRAAALKGEGLYWIEVPTRADDYSGHARIRRDSKTLIQIGENWWGPHDAAKSIEAGASDYAMPDTMKIGGVTGWLRTAALAEAAGIPLSSHLFSEISAHLLAVSPTRHWLEYVDWANPIGTFEGIGVGGALASGRTRLGDVRHENWPEGSGSGEGRRHRRNATRPQALGAPSSKAYVRR
jgi:mandelate racemase